MAKRTIANPETTREVRGRDLFRERGSEIVRVGPHCWVVPSRTKPGVECGVDLVLGFCTCPVSVYNHKVCSHVFAAEIASAKRTCRSRSAPLFWGSRSRPPLSLCCLSGPLKTYYSGIHNYWTGRGWQASLASLKGAVIVLPPSTT